MQAKEEPRKTYLALLSVVPGIRGTGDLLMVKVTFTRMGDQYYAILPNEDLGPAKDEEELKGLLWAIYGDETIEIRKTY